MIKLLIYKTYSQLKYFRRGIKEWGKRFLLRYSVRKLLQRKTILKIVIGSGGIHNESWLNTDFPILDALNRKHWQFIFPKQSIDRMFAEHVIEHWSQNYFLFFLKIIRPFFSDIGFLRIAVPDGFHFDKNYIDLVKPGGAGCESHQVLYNYKNISNILLEASYDFRLHEYFDEHGNFHHFPMNENDGRVRRSAFNDERNKEKPLSYTSLIIDVWPKR